MSRGTPGYTGIVGILGGLVGVGVLMTVFFGLWAHWLPIAATLVVGLWAVQAIHK
jgi:hypothetical protein